MEAAFFIVVRRFLPETAALPSGDCKRSSRSTSRATWRNPCSVTNASKALPVARVTSWPASLSPTPRATKGWTSPRLPMERIVMFMYDSALLLTGGFLSRTKSGRGFSYPETSHQGKHLSASYLLPSTKLCSSTRCPLDLLPQKAPLLFQCKHLDR